MMRAVSAGDGDHNLMMIICRLRDDGLGLNRPDYGASHE